MIFTASWQNGPISALMNRAGIIDQMVDTPLQRLIGFFGYTIDDVVNRREVKRVIYEAYKVRCFIERERELRQKEIWVAEGDVHGNPSNAVV